MPWAWWLVTAALAGPKPIVAVGDGLVVEQAPAAIAAEVVADAAPAEPEAEKATVPGGWVAVLADCLEERRTGQYALLDRTADQPSTRKARERVAEIRETLPALVIVGVGAAGDAERDQLRADLGDLVEALRATDGPDVLLVGPIPPIEPQEADERRFRAWNDDVQRVAVAGGAAHLDLSAAWPADAEERAALTRIEGRLSDQGHARVGALVCDAVLAWEAVP